jgi:hypothetical protein
MLVLFDTFDDLGRGLAGYSFTAYFRFSSETGKLTRHQDLIFIAIITLIKAPRT